jgi:exonuclease SbcC
VRITHLELENFKSYAKEWIDFLAGTNAITGENGAGKSTLLEAIGFALFDHLESGLRLSSLLREGTRSGRVVVGLVSSHDEREYEVERCFTSKTTTRYRVYDQETGQCLTEGSEDALAWLHQHLQVEPLAALDTLFENTVGVPQGTFTAPFLQTTSARKAIFDPLLQVEEYKKASDSLLETSNWLDGQVGALNQDLANLQGQLLALPGLRTEGQALGVAVAELEQRSAILQAKLQATLQELERFDQAEAQVRDLAKRIEHVQVTITAQELLLQNGRRQLEEAESAQNQVVATRAAHEAYLTAEECLTDLEQQRRRRDQLQQQRSRLETTLAGITAQLDQLARELMEISAAAQRMQALEPSLGQQRALEEALRQAEEEVLRLEAAQKREQDAARELAQAQAVLERRTVGQEQAKALEQEIVGMHLKLDELSRKLGEVREERATRTSDIERLHKQSAALRDSATARCPVCEAELTPAHRGELLARNEQQARELGLVVAALEERLSNMGHETEGFSQELASAQKRLQRLPSDEDVHEAELAVAERQSAWKQAQAEVAPLEAAPDRAEAQRRALAALGDPRLEYQRCADRVCLGPARAEEQRQATARHEELATAMAGLEAQLAGFATLDDDLRAAQQRRDEHRQAHNTYVANLGVAQQLETRRQKVETLAAALEGLERDLTDLNAQHQRALARYDAERHVQARKQVSSWEQELAGGKAEMREKAVRLEALRQDVARLEALQGHLGQKEKALAELQHLGALVSTVRGLLRKAGPYVTQRLVQQISREASVLYGDIIGDHSGRLQWSEDYELALEVKGRKRTFHQLSGGEQMSAALALRLALLRETSAIDVAFFDEPTAHLDPARREGLAEKITQVKGFSQLFVISHDDTFERAAQNYIRIYKDEQGSHPVRA